MKTFVDYYEDDHRAIDEPVKEFKRLIRLQPDKIQCEVMREIIPETSMNDFWILWKPDDLIIASRKIVRDELQKKLYALQKEKFPALPVPLCYRPADTRQQNIDVEIPSVDTESVRIQNLVLNDIVLVAVDVVEIALNMDKSPWKLGYAITIHSSQGLTITDTKVWIVDDRIEWSNLVYLAVSRVRRISQLKRVIVDCVITEEITNSVDINKKLVSYKQCDKKK